MGSVAASAAAFCFSCPADNKGDDVGSTDLHFAVVSGWLGIAGVLRAGVSVCAGLQRSLDLDDQELSLLFLRLC